MAQVLHTVVMIFGCYNSFFHFSLVSFRGKDGNWGGQQLKLHFSFTRYNEILTLLLSP